MKMIINQVDGKREWNFSVSDYELYEILCTQIAWRTLWTSKKPVDWVVTQTISAIHTVDTRSEKDLAKISDPFIRAILTELKRLEIDLGGSASEEQTK